MTRTRHGIVSAAHPLAVNSGLKILKEGGNAIDAAVATAFTLFVVDPGDAGFGGAGFMNIYTTSNSMISIVDFNAIAPSGATKDTYEVLPGVSAYTGYAQVKGDENVYGPKSISVPGAVDGLSLALDRFGTLNLKKVLRGAIDAATKGFEVTRCISREIYGELELIRRYNETAKMFIPNDHVPQPGQKMFLPYHARTLRAFAKAGGREFYEGQLGVKIADHLQRMGGLITQEDLAKYHAEVLQPAHINYRGFDIFAPAVGGSGLCVMEGMNIIENASMEKIDYCSAKSVHIIAESMKLAWADRLAYDSDPEFSKVPLNGLLSKSYARSRYHEIRPNSSSVKALPGNPWKFDEDPLGPVRKPSSQTPPAMSHTTHLCVVDKDRNMVSLTQTLWGAYGSGVSIPGTGIVMNNGQSRLDPDQKSVNRVEPGKRILSNMSPMLILREGEPFATLGSPGGRKIVGTIIQMTVNLIDHKTGVDAVAAPRFHCETAEPLLVEHDWIDKMPTGIFIDLEKIGHRFEVVTPIGEPGGYGYPYISGAASVITIDQEKKMLVGAGDPRQPGYSGGY